MHLYLSWLALETFTANLRRIMSSFSNYRADDYNSDLKSNFFPSLPALVCSALKIFFYRHLLSAKPESL